MKKTHSLLTLIAVLVIAGLLAKSALTPPAPPVEVAIVLDTTFKDKVTKDRITKVAAAFCEELHRKDTLSLYAVDNKTSLEYRANPMTAAQATELCQRLFAHPIALTDLATCFETLAREFAASGPPTYLVIWSDGQDDGKAKEVALRLTAAAKALARCPRIRRVTIQGVIRDARPGWKPLSAMLSPLGAKLSIQPDISLETLERGYKATVTEAKAH